MVFRVAGILALGLLLLNVVGLYIPAISTTTLHNKTPVAGYEVRTLAVSDARREYLSLLTGPQNLSPEEKARKLFDIISGSYLHTDEQYALKPWDNWFLWLKAMVIGDPFFQKMFLDPHDEKMLWRRGGGFCHQAAWIFAEKARALGLKAHLVNLPAHYVAEVQVAPDTWHTVDVDTGIYWGIPIESFRENISSEELLKTFIDKGFSKQRAEALSGSYPSRDNDIQLFKRGFLYTQDAYVAAQDGNFYRWVFPLILLAVWILFELFIRLRKLKRQNTLRD